MILALTIIPGIALTVYCCFFHDKDNEPKEMHWL